MLEKAVWTDADFAQMGWHDAHVYAIAFPEAGDRSELLIDLDYIVRWVQPEQPGSNVSFWVAPATLVFHDAGAIVADVNADAQLEIDDVTLHDDGRWHVIGHNFELSCIAAGFTQYFRARPTRCSRQALGLAERGGLSFDRPQTLPD